MSMEEDSQYAWVPSYKAQDSKTCSSIPWEALSKGDTNSVTQWLTQLKDTRELTNKDEDGRTLLHWACARREWNQWVPLLLEAGSPIATSDDGGFSPLHSSCSCGNTQVVQWLLSASQALGNSLDMVNVKTDDSQLTPLHCAASKNNLEICKLLIEYGALVNAVDVHGYTPLMRAAQKGNDECLAFLLSRGAIVNVRNRQGDTALHLACEMGYRSTVQILLATKGIDSSIRNEEGYTARDLLAPELQGWWPE
ncbi:26S proteasome non-ATPase regulatory subunit 10 [Galdieria sulphuraria]|uniref:26S proteasome non-ATPase regulatory subunit 1 n=1 Tax=Galdieria sulphuraria TaxID=130081 RepID=M2W940_GALSU|nr:26S proteasome non-ATPase regulatory subunit 1 [Galdieria sulphuraria]EME32366.1 26S proteasome non-ATPase regulatory subunit 1 [Galdieria sulphuraria]GJD06137.1 26S proteasome non-ATPase regulatory subunit 10 [Galdieria sulphuraria]|eukprot:XP_005708886.1 26S proteasome non-ATPase regulatory subunit 1 [Galdieria sulphuraria]